jgi:hypothetical protein
MGWSVARIRWASLLLLLFSDLALLLIAPGFQQNNGERESLGGFQNMFQTFQKLNFVSDSLQRFANIKALILILK